MKERNLKILALAGGILGVVVLMVISDNIEVDTKAISKITAADLENGVRVEGVVQKVNSMGGVTMIEVSQPQDIKVLVFGSADLKRGDHVDVKGKVEEYEGEYEIIADVIRLT